MHLGPVSPPEPTIPQESNFYPSVVKHHESNFCSYLGIALDLITTLIPLSESTVSQLQSRYLKVAAIKTLREYLCKPDFPYDMLLTLKLALNFFQYKFINIVPFDIEQDLINFFSKGSSFFAYEVLSIAEHLFDMQRRSYYQSHFQDQLTEIAQNDDVLTLSDLFERKLLDLSEENRGITNRIVSEAAGSGSHKVLDYLFNHGFSINGFYPHWTPLMDAIFENREDTVKWLLDNKANPNLASDQDCSPLYIASQQNNTKITQLLLKASADPNSKCREWTALHHAVEKGYQDVVTVLLDYLADTNIMGPNNITALRFAVLGNHYDIANNLIAHGANPNSTIDDAPLLYHATAKNASSVVLNLLKKGVSPNPRYHNWTALHHAAETGRLPILNHLLDFNANPNLLGPNNITALYFAINNKYEEVALSLLNRNANPNMKVYEIPPIYLATSHNLTSVVEKLLEKGADPNSLFSNWTSLHHAAETGKFKILNHLLEFKANPNIIGPYNTTPLYFAINNNHTREALSLLNYKANASAVVNKMPPIYLATSHNLTSVVEKLLEMGADPNSQYNGWAPLNLASKEGNLAILNTLLRFKANPNLELPRPPLSLSFFNNHTKCARLLLENGADADLPDHYGYSILLSLAEYDWVVDLEETLPYVKNLDLDAKLLTIGNASFFVSLRESHNALLDQVKDFLNIDAASFNPLKENLRATSLTYLFKNKHYHLVDKLIKKGADINKAFKAFGYFLADYILSTENPYLTLEKLYQHNFNSQTKDGLGYDLVLYFDMLLQDPFKPFTKDEIKNLIKFIYQHETKKMIESDEELISIALGDRNIDRIAALYHTGINFDHRDANKLSVWDKMENDIQQSLSQRGISKPWFKFW